MKKIISVIVIVLLLGGLGGFAYYQYKQSPKYSLKSAFLAIKSNNKMLMEKYVDFDSIIGEALNESFSKDKELAENPFAMGMLALMKPAIVNVAKETLFAQMKAASEKSNQSSQNNQGKNADTGNPIKSVKSVKTIQKDGDIATAEIIFIGLKGQEIPLTLGMQKIGDYWQIKQIMNFEDFSKAVNFDLQEAINE